MRKIFLAGTAVACAVLIIMLVPARTTALPDCFYSISADPGEINFASQIVGADSGPQNVTITNSSIESYSGACSTLAVYVGKSGDGADQFNVTDDCSYLVVGQTCTAAVVFSPDTEGSFDAVLNITTTGGTGPSDSTTLTGTGTTTAGAGNDSASALLLYELSNDDSDGCIATASTGRYGKSSFSPSAFGLIALMGLVLGIMAVRRRIRKI